MPIVDFEVPGTHNYIAAGAIHHNSGKTEAGGFCGATLARQGVEPTRPAVGKTTTVWDRATSGWVACVNFRTLWETVEPKYFDNNLGRPGSQPFIPKWEIAEWRKSDRVLKLKNGSIIGFRSYDAGPMSFASAGKDWIHFDEEPPKSVYNEAVIRVEAGRRLRVFGTATLLPPEGVVGGVSWLFPEIIQPAQRGRQGVGIFSSSIYENPHIDREEITRLESKYPEGSPERRIRLDGELVPGVGGARVYGAFDFKLHVKPLGDPNPRMPLCWALDFNVSPYCTLVGQFARESFLVYREIIMEDGGNTPEMVDRFRTIFPAHPHEIFIYGDATGNNRDTRSGKDDYRLIKEAMRTYPTPARVRVPERNPFVTDRCNAVNMALRDPRGEVRLLVDENCLELIADLEEVIKDPAGGIKKTHNRADPYYRRTHTSDALGYWVHRERPVTAYVADHQPTLPTHAVGMSTPFTLARGGRR